MPWPAAVSHKKPVHRPDERESRRRAQTLPRTGPVYVRPKDGQPEEGPRVGTGPKQGGAAGRRATAPSRPWAGGRDREPARNWRLRGIGGRGELFAATQSLAGQASGVPSRQASLLALVQVRGCRSLPPGSRRKPVGGVAFLPGAGRRQASQGEKPLLPTLHQSTHHTQGSARLQTALTLRTSCGLDIYFLYCLVGFFCAYLGLAFIVVVIKKILREKSVCRALEKFQWQSRPKGTRDFVFSLLV